MIYPDNCIRGVPNIAAFFNTDGTVGSNLFHFESGRDRGDGWTDISINWEDDNTAIEFTLNQKKPDGETHFKGGVVVVPRAEIDRLNNRPMVRGLLSYERQSLPDNPFHGNILLRANTPKSTMKLIAAGLALAITSIRKRE